MRISEKSIFDEIYAGYMLLSTIFFYTTKWRPRPLNTQQSTFSQMYAQLDCKQSALESLYCAMILSALFSVKLVLGFFHIIQFIACRVCSRKRTWEKKGNVNFCVCIFPSSLIVLKVFFVVGCWNACFRSSVHFVCLSEQKCERKPIFFLTSSDHLVFHFSPYEDYVRARSAVLEILNIWTIFLLFYYYVCVSTAIHLTTNRFKRKSCVSKFWSGNQI